VCGPVTAGSRSVHPEVVGETPGLSAQRPLRRAYDQYPEAGTLEEADLTGDPGGTKGAETRPRLRLLCRARLFGGSISQNVA
jgi:hypothetical protein